MRHTQIYCLLWLHSINFHINKFCNITKFLIGNNKRIHNSPFSRVSDAEKSLSIINWECLCEKELCYILCSCTRHRLGDQPFDAPSNCVLLVLDRRAEGTSIMLIISIAPAAQIIARRVINLNDGESSRARSHRTNQNQLGANQYTYKHIRRWEMCALQHGSSPPRKHREKNLMRDWRFRQKSVVLLLADRTNQILR